MFGIIHIFFFFLKKKNLRIYIDRSLPVDRNISPLASVECRKLGLIGLLY